MKGKSEVLTMVRPAILGSNHDNEILLSFGKYQGLEILRYPNHNRTEDVIYMGRARGKKSRVLKDPFSCYNLNISVLG